MFKSLEPNRTSPFGHFIIYNHWASVWFLQGQLHGNHVTIKKHSVTSSSEQKLPPSMSQYELCKNEVQILPKLQHNNIVKLLGFCAERSERIVVYEHMENGSLEDVIFGMLICLLIINTDILYSCTHNLFLRFEINNLANNNLSSPLRTSCSAHGSRVHS